MLWGLSDFCKYLLFCLWSWRACDMPVTRAWDRHSTLWYVGFQTIWFICFYDSLYQGTLACFFMISCPPVFYDCVVFKISWFWFCLMIIWNCAFRWWLPRHSLARKRRGVQCLRGWGRGRHRLLIWCWRSQFSFALFASLYSNIGVGSYISR